MDKYTTQIVIVAIFAIILILFFTVFRSKGKFRIKTLFGRVDAEGTNEQSVGISIENTRAGRDITAQTTTADTVKMNQVDAGRDIRVSKSAPDSKKK